jgi:hypothetical protein
MRLLSGKPLAVAAVLAAVPAMAVAQGQGPGDLPTPAKAYGVICERPPYDIARDNRDHADCVRALAQGVNGGESASDAARRACRQATPPLPGDEFGKCVSSTKTLLHGLRALKAR